MNSKKSKKSGHKRNQAGRQNNLREPSRRQKMIAAEVFEILSTSIINDLSDPRIAGISITHIDVSGDLQHAKVFVSSSHSDTNIEKSLEGLSSAKGFLRKKLAERLNTKKVPDLQFMKDAIIYNAWELEKVIEEIPENE